ncbi:FHA domain-containing protein [Synechococcales cyanobacterium C]|uniref:FHA domain-containing protein n=1 Tax=Petrachloros mirabilis ULC683 TaxID=2781853 RepID=A0A8K2A8S4_9CYAN|nr:FHA domain-containing protein [Petrachloros mirabilis ULC683]
MTPIEIPQFIIRSESGLRRLSLSGQTSWIVGRSKSHGIWIDDPWASRRHAQVELLHNRYYCLTDLNSRNGTLLNGVPVNTPTRLKHGDRICIGNTELEFMDSISVANGSARWEAQPQVLMLQHPTPQSMIWQNILQSQNILIQWHLPEQDIEAELTSRDAKGGELPQVLLLDVALYPANPYALCRWCSEAYPQIKIILLNSTQREVMPTERHWALKQGGFGLLPALPETGLLANMSEVQQHLGIILDALHLSLNQDAFISALTHLEAQLTFSKSSDPKSTEEGEYTRLSRWANSPVVR